MLINDVNPATFPSKRNNTAALLSSLNSEGYEQAYLSAQVRTKARRARRFDTLGDEARSQLGSILVDTLAALHVRDLDDVEAGLHDAIDLLATIDELDRKEDGHPGDHLETMEQIETHAEDINASALRTIASTEGKERRALASAELAQSA